MVGAVCEEVGSTNGAKRCGEHGASNGADRAEGRGCACLRRYAAGVSVEDRGTNRADCGAEHGASTEPFSRSSGGWKGDGVTNSAD